MRLHRALPAAGITLAAVAFAATITHTLSADFSGAQSTATNISSAGDQLALTSLTHTASNQGGTANWYRSATDFTTSEFQLELEKDDEVELGDDDSDRLVPNDSALSWSTILEDEDVD